MDIKSTFKGTIISIQPFIRLTRSFDETSLTYLGYSIILEGEINNQHNIFSIGIDEKAQVKHQFKVNDVICGECVPVSDIDFVTVQYSKVSKVKVIFRSTITRNSSPWTQVPPDLEVYRERGYRRLAAKTYDSKCCSCMWGVRMPVVIIIDNWNPRGNKKYRLETFCYGPLNCKLYKAGANRKVEGRNGMIYIEEDWVDQMAVEDRDPEQ